MRWLLLLFLAHYRKAAGIILLKYEKCVIFIFNSPVMVAAIKYIQNNLNKLN